MAAPRSWATDAADVLAFEVVEVVDVGRARRGRLHYFLNDGTAAVSTSRHPPAVFRLGAGPGERHPLRLRPRDLAVGASVPSGGADWEIVDAEPACRRYYERFGATLGARVDRAGAYDDDGGPATRTLAFFGDDGAEKFELACFLDDGTAEARHAGGAVRVSHAPDAKRSRLGIFVHA